eukprot:Em0009g555a
MYYGTMIRIPGLVKTPLYGAAENGHTAVLEMLLRAGADMNKLIGAIILSAGCIQKGTRPKAYQTLASLVAPETPGGKTYDELIKLMAEHLSPKPLVIVQRYRFHSRVRQQGESVSVYVTQLKELARKCEFGDALNDMLRDRLVCGINDERVQKRLLVEVLELEPRGVTGVCGGTTLLISAHIEVLSVLGVAKEVISGGRVNKYKRRLGECSHLGEEYRCCKRSQKT